MEPRRAMDREIIEVKKGLTEVGESLGRLTTAVDNHIEKFNAHVVRFDGHVKRFDRHEQIEQDRDAAIEEKLTRIDDSTRALVQFSREAKAAGRFSKRIVNFIAHVSGYTVLITGIAASWRWLYTNWP